MHYFYAFYISIFDRSRNIYVRKGINHQFKFNKRKLLNAQYAWVRKLFAFCFSTRNGLKKKTEEKKKGHFHARPRPVSQSVSLSNAEAALTARAARDQMRMRVMFARADTDGRPAAGAASVWSRWR